jgi:hypothetical protein
MAHSTVLGISIVNYTPNVDPDEIMHFIDSADGYFETYSLAPSRPGTIRGAAFDFVIVLSVVASIASIVALLWMAYEKFLAPKKSSQSDNAGLHIIIQKPDGSVVDFGIGSEYNDKDIFIQDFTASVRQIHESEDDLGFYARSEAEIKCTDMWIRRK